MSKFINEKINSHFWLLLFIFCIQLTNYAQGPGDPCACEDAGYIFDPSVDPSCTDPCDPFCRATNCVPDTNIPINQGVLWLMLAGCVYFVYVAIKQMRFLLK